MPESGECRRLCIESWGRWMPALWSPSLTQPLTRSCRQGTLFVHCHQQLQPLHFAPLYASLVSKQTHWPDLYQSTACQGQANWHRRALLQTFAAPHAGLARQHPDPTQGHHGPADGAPAAHEGQPALACTPHPELCQQQHQHWRGVGRPRPYCCRGCGCTEGRSARGCFWWKGGGMHT